MEPSWRIADDPDQYTPAVKTDVRATWERFGWKPTTEEERKARQRRASNEDNRSAA